MSTTVDLGKITASVTVGTTTTGAAGTNASVSNSGTTQDAVLNFTIPRGAQGVQGPQGSTGPQGPAGPTGPQGPMGDVAVITPEQQAAFTMYSTTGQNTDGPMTQKAVTDNLVASAISYDNSQSGLASNNVQGALDEEFKNSLSLNNEIYGGKGYGYTLAYPKNSRVWVAINAAKLVAGRKYRFHVVLSALNTGGYTVSAYQNNSTSGQSASLFTHYGAPELEYDRIVTWPEGNFNYIGGYNAGNAFTANITVTEIGDSTVTSRIDGITSVINKRKGNILSRNITVSGQHSSNSDVLVVDIPAKTPFSLRLVTAVENAAVEIRYIDNNNVNRSSGLGNFKNNWADAICDYDIHAIGLTVLSGYNGMYTYEVCFELPSKDELQVKTTTFNVTTANHSSTKDRIIIDGTSKYIIASVESSVAQPNAAFQFYSFDSSGNSTALMAGSIPNLFFVRVPEDCSTLGVFTRDTVSATITLKVYQGNLIKTLFDDNRYSVNIKDHYKSYDFRRMRSQLLSDKAFSALFFSDIHGRTDEFKRIIELANGWKGDLNAVIDGGDDTANTINATPITNWYNPLMSTCELPIIRAVGNHDSWTSAAWTWATNQQVYNYMTAITVADLEEKGITPVQPSDVATSYKNYYYVDFPNNIRVIVLLSLIYSSQNAYWDNDQLEWFTDVLANANTNWKSVIVLNHGGLDPNEVEDIECPWSSSIRSWSNGGVADTQHVPASAINAVDSFITAGGKFICWIAGHTHSDSLVVTKNTTHKQLCFITSTANGSPLDSIACGGIESKQYDLFNLISVDTTNKLFKCMRIGLNNNKALQEHNYFCWDYKNKKLVGWG